MDFAVARRMMVDGQVLTRDVFDPDLLAAMLEVPREQFVPPAQAALAYIRGRAQALGLSREFYRNVDIHLHVPEGAIPKDGPSAGITMATALASALAKIPVRRDIAMTGEITLRGKVLPIGGLKEKLLAALRAGIFEAILPKSNEKDVAELPDNIKNSMKLHFVDVMDEVLALALESPLPTPVPQEAEVLSTVPPSSDVASGQVSRQ